MKKKDTLDAVLKRVITEEYKKIISEQPQAAPLPKTPLPQINTKSNPAEIEKQQIAKIIAKKIYNSKGTLYDKEFDAVKAIEEIPDVSTFNYVQQELQKLTGGRGIGQYLISFITVGGKSRSQTSIITKQYLNQIIMHLTKINAPKNTINILSNYLRNDFDAEQNETWHTVNLVLQIAGSVVATVVAGPAAGAAVAAAIGAADAKQYWDEGEPEMAGLMMFLSAVPGVGMLGKGGVKALVRKIVAKEALKESEKRFLTQALAKRAAAKEALQRKVAEGLTSGLVKPWMVKGTQFGAGWLKYATIPTLGYEQFLEPQVRAAYNSLQGGILTSQQEKQIDDYMYAEMQKQDSILLQQARSKSKKFKESVNKVSSPTLNETRWTQDDVVVPPVDDGSMMSSSTVETILYIIAAVYAGYRYNKWVKKRRAKGKTSLFSKLRGKRNITAQEKTAGVVDAMQQAASIKADALRLVKEEGWTPDRALAWTREELRNSGLDPDRAVTKDFETLLRASASNKNRNVVRGFQSGRYLKLTSGDEIFLKNMSTEEVDRIRNMNLNIHSVYWLRNNPNATYREFINFRRSH